MSITKAVEEAQRSLTRVRSTPILESKKEFENNCYPLLVMLGEATANEAKKSRVTLADLGERLELIENYIAEQINQEHVQSALLPDMASRLHICFAVALRVCELAEVPCTQEEADARAPAIGELRRLIATLTEEIESITLVAVEDDEDDDEDEDEYGDGDGGPDGDGTRGDGDGDGGGGAAAATEETNDSKTEQQSA